MIKKIGFIFILLLIPFVYAELGYDTSTLPRLEKQTTQTVAGSGGTTIITNENGILSASFQGQHTLFNPGDNTVMRVGGMALPPTSAEGVEKIYFPFNMELRYLSYNNFVAGTKSSTEDIGFFISVNGTSDFFVGNMLFNDTSLSLINNSLSINVSQNDYFVLKYITPNWTTNPVTVRASFLVHGISNISISSTNNSAFSYNQTIGTFNIINSTQCPSGEYAFGLFLNGSFMCRTDQTGGGGGNPFDQVLNTTSTVLFNVTRITSYLDIDRLNIGENPIANFSRIYGFEKNDLTRLRIRHSDGFESVINRDNYFIARNTNGSLMRKGTVVYVSGSSGNNPNIQPAISNDSNRFPAIGVLAEDINNNAFGRVIISGQVEGFDTSLFNEGDAVYLSSTTAGGLTTTQPFSPSFRQRIGIVLNSHMTNGKLDVDTQAVLFGRISTGNIPFGDTDSIQQTNNFNYNVTSSILDLIHISDNGETSIRISNDGGILTGLISNFFSLIPYSSISDLGNFTNRWRNLWVNNITTNRIFLNGSHGFIFANNGNLSSKKIDLTDDNFFENNLLVSNGGTGFGTYTKGDIIISQAMNTLSKLSIGNTGEVLTVNSGGTPSWSNVTHSNSPFMIGGGVDGAVTVSTQNYMAIFGDDTVSTLIETKSSMAPFNMVLSNLTVRKGSGAVSVNISLWVNGVQTGLFCTTPAVGVTNCFNNNETVTINRFDNYTVGYRQFTTTSTGNLRYNIKAVEI
jgi:hypothetical protein